MILYKRIKVLMTSLVLFRAAVFVTAVAHFVSLPPSSMVFWLGDLNYRLPPTAELTVESIKAHADSYQIPALLKHDQLLQEMEKEAVLAGFTEAPIDFKPSYKYDPNTDNWDTRCV